MHNLRYNIILFLLFITSYHYAQYTDIINSNRPGNSISAFSVGKTVFQTETGIYGVKESLDILNYNTNGLGAELSLRYGAFLEQLEFIVNLQYQFDQHTSRLNNTINRNDFKNTAIGAKYLIYDPFKNYEEKISIRSWNENQKFKWRSLIPVIAAYAGANFDISKGTYYPSEPFFSPNIMLITQNHFSGKWVFITNIFVDKIATNYTDYGYILSLTRGFDEKWSGFLETQKNIKKNYSNAIFRIGTAYLVHKNLQIDASISKNMKNIPDFFYGGIGLSWRFDKFQKDAIIDLNKEKENEGEKEEIEKPIENKRIDEFENLFEEVEEPIDNDTKKENLNLPEDAEESKGNENTKSIE